MVEWRIWSGTVWRLMGGVGEGFGVPSSPWGLGFALFFFGGLFRGLVLTPLLTPMLEASPECRPIFASVDPKSLYFPKLTASASYPVAITSQDVDAQDAEGEGAGWVDRYRTKSSEKVKSASPRVKYTLLLRLLLGVIALGGWEGWRGKTRGEDIG